MRDNLFRPVIEDLSLNALFLRNVQEICVTVLGDKGKEEFLAGARRHVERIAPNLDKVIITDLTSGKNLASFYSSTLSLIQTNEVMDRSEEEDERRQKRLLSLESASKETGDNKRMKVKSTTSSVQVKLSRIIKLNTFISFTQY